MLQEVMENTKKNMQNAASCVLICPKCSHISRTTDVRCLYCGAHCEKNKAMTIQMSSDFNCSPPRKIPRNYPPQFTTPILILSVGRDGVFDARHSPCVITPNVLSCKVKVEGVWIPVDIMPSEVEAMLFSEELQLIFLRLREAPRHALCSNLKVEKLDAAKWLVMVLGNNIQKPSGINLMVQQLEIFGSTIRQHDGFCKMNYTCDETRKLLLDCGLRLPRAEALAAKDGGTSGSSECKTAGITANQSNSSIDAGQHVNYIQGEANRSVDAPVNNPNEGGLLTNVIKNLSSVGMHILNSCQSTLTPSSRDDRKISEKVEDCSYGDDIIILSEEGIDQHHPIGGKDIDQSDPHDCLNSSERLPATKINNTPGSTTEPTIKFGYQPPGSPDSVMITSSDLECLPPGCLVNDTIINFYLKYLYFEQLSDLQRRCTHLFNCFFYSRLANTPNLAPQAGSNSSAAVVVGPKGCSKPDQHE